MIVFDTYILIETLWSSAELYTNRNELSACSMAKFQWVFHTKSKIISTNIVIPQRISLNLHA